ncbi:response regulator [Sphingomonas sp. Sphisp140]|uniref:response regulator n=1 Tax=unclassified Sphingomonas TaxID=196159 RepID=UPI0039B0F0A0
MSIDHGAMTVLVVEDDALIRMHGVDILGDGGFHVLEAANADDALVILSDRADVQLLFSDIDMPGSMDGLNLARVVCERWPSIHLLLTSGQHGLQDGDVPGTARFVRKPWSSQGLLDRVRDMVKV